MKFSEIKKGVPIPDAEHGPRKGYTQDGPSLGSILKKLEIGDCFTIFDSRSETRTGVFTRAKNLGIKVTTRVDAVNNKMTIWRLED